MCLPLARYEVSGLAVDEWGFFSLELPAKHGNASKVEIILERLYEEGDPVLFVQKSRKPTQRDYSHCTYEKWREGHPKQWDDEVLCLFPPCALISHAQGSSGVAATTPFV